MERFFFAVLALAIIGALSYYVIWPRLKDSELYRRLTGQPKTKGGTSIGPKKDSDSEKK